MSGHCRSRTASILAEPKASHHPSSSIHLDGSMGNTGENTQKPRGCAFRVSSQSSGININDHDSAADGEAENQGHAAELNVQWIAAV